jgi:hypothetical protein
LEWVEYDRGIAINFGGNLEMNQEPKLSLFSEAQCVSDRPEVAPIAGKRVAIIGRDRDSVGEWSYRVYNAVKTTSPTFICFETELIPVAPIPLVSDAERLEGVVAETARLRYSVVDNGLRSLLPSAPLLQAAEEKGGDDGGGTDAIRDS